MLSTKWPEVNIITYFIFSSLLDPLSFISGRKLSKQIYMGSAFTFIDPLTFFGWQDGKKKKRESRKESDDWLEQMWYETKSKSDRCQVDVFPLFLSTTSLCVQAPRKEGKVKRGQINNVMTQGTCRTWWLIVKIVKTYFSSFLGSGNLFENSGT